MPNLNLNLDNVQKSTASLRNTLGTKTAIVPTTKHHVDRSRDLRHTTFDKGSKQ